MKNLLQHKNWLAAIFVLFAFALVEFGWSPLTGLTTGQQIAAAILIIAAVLWISEWVPLYVVSFLILALELIWLLPELAHEGHPADPAQVFGSFFSNIILLFMGGFVLSALLQKYGIDIRFAQAILARTHGNSTFTLLGIILSSAFLSMWMSNTATTAMMLTIIFPLIQKVPEDHPFRTALVLSIPFACNIGGIGTPIGTPPNAIALGFLAKAGYNVGFLKWMALVLPFMLVFLFILWRLLLRLYPPKDLILTLEARTTGKWSYRHAFAVGIFIVTALGWMLSDHIGIKTGTVALFPILACFWFGFLDTDDFRKLPWDILYIISGGLALGVALTASGLDKEVVKLLPTDTAPIIILALAALTAGLMSTVMSNTATAGLLIPLVMTLKFEGNFILSLVLATALMCSMAMALPVTTPPNAIAFSSRAIKTRDMMIAGGIMTIVGYVFISLLGPMYWRLLTNF